MPPCGSPLITTMKSVPLPVSLLSASSETIRTEPGDMTSVMRSMASCGMLSRSSAALAAPTSAGTGSALRSTRCERRAYP